MSGLVMVTGASGQLGRQVVEFLSERLPANRIAAMARRPGTLGVLTGTGISVRYGDYNEPDGLARAFHGVEKLLLVSATAGSTIGVSLLVVILGLPPVSARRQRNTPMPGGGRPALPGRSLYGIRRDIPPSRTGSGNVTCRSGRAAPGCDIAGPEPSTAGGS